MKKFKNKYRIPSARLPSWDYRNNGAYFITICTGNREHFFGHVEKGKMQLTEIGKFAEQFWMEIPKHFPFVELGNFVIMPNHMHGILIIDKSNDEKSDKIELADEMDIPVQTLQCNVSAGKSIDNSNFESGKSIDNSNHDLGNLNKNKNEIMANISPKAGSISTIIRSYKSVTTKHARKINPDFTWQTRFHDIIIRDNQAFINISNYIENNPKKWEEDKFNSK